MTRKFTLPSPSAGNRDPDYAGDLNEQQYAAVTCGEGPKLIIAGAGSGKTRTLTYRVAWLLSQGIAPDRILLVTFTNKAAREMVERVRGLTGTHMHQLWGGTFHSVGAHLLRRHGHLLGYSDSFSILDGGDQLDLIRLCVTDGEIPVERKRFPSPKVLRSVLSLHANTRSSLGELLAQRYPDLAQWEQEIRALGRRYAERKRAANAMDYDDLLVLWLKLLRQHPEVRLRYGQQLRHILVDEYQDTNLIQGEIVEVLAAANGGNLLVVGDDCQSIYAFRGAHYENILGFPERNPGTEIFRLETNYRSTPEILELANASIRCNRSQYRKHLRAHRAPGMQPALVPCHDPQQEATFVAERILQLRDEGTPLREMAILYRAHSHRLSVETTLLRYDIPYQVRGGVRFFEQAHIKDVTAHLRVIRNPRDEIAFRRALLLQPGIGKVTARRTWRAVGTVADAQQLLKRLADEALTRPLGARARSGWKAFCATLGAVAENANQPEAAVQAVLEHGYAEYAATRFTNPDSRLEDLEQLSIFAAQYESVGSFLEELVLLGELYGQDVGAAGAAEESSVILSTVHQAKGLEWDVVFLVHLVEGALPSPRALEDPGGEEEERRIFYVAMTRARNELYLSYPMIRPGGRKGSLLQQPSRFLQELPAALTEPWDLLQAPQVAPAGDRERSWNDRERSWNLESVEYDPNVDPLYNDEDFPQ